MLGCNVGLSCLQILSFEVDHPAVQGSKVRVRVMYRTKTTIEHCTGLLKSLLALCQINLGYKRFHRDYFDPNSCRKLPNSELVLDELVR